MPFYYMATKTIFQPLSLGYNKIVTLLDTLLHHQHNAMEINTRITVNQRDNPLTLPAISTRVITKVKPSANLRRLHRSRLYSVTLPLRICLLRAHAQVLFTTASRNKYRDRVGFPSVDRQRSRRLAPMMLTEMLTF